MGSNLKNIFDTDKNAKYYNCTMNLGEIGCTLSHQKCYMIITKEVRDFAHVLEDDVIIENTFKDAIPLINAVMRTKIPTVLLLSGMYWYSPVPTKFKDKDLKIVRVRDALLRYLIV